MNTKLILYCIVTPILIWAMNGLNINHLIKKNKIYEARILYIMIGLSLSCLVVNFLYDFMEASKIY